MQKMNAKDDCKRIHDRHIPFPFGSRVWRLSQRVRSAINSFDAAAMIFWQKPRPWVSRAVVFERTKYSQIPTTDLLWLGPRGRLRICREYAQNWTGAETNCHNAYRIFGVFKSSTSQCSISMIYTWDEPRIFVTVHEYNKYSCPKFLCILHIIKSINS